MPAPTFTKSEQLRTREALLAAIRAEQNPHAAKFAGKLYSPRDLIEPTLSDIDRQMAEFNAKASASGRRAAA